MYLIYPPELKDTPKMAEMAREELKSMGPMSKAEWILALDFILLLFLWTVGDLVFHIPATISAFIGLVILLLTNIMSWKNIVAETTAWDTMFWFAVLVMMANALNKYGAMYFYTRYFFASAMAHISAMYLAFVAAAIAVGTPPIIAAIGLGYTSTLSMSLTQYAGGPGPALYGSGYNSTGQWWGVSFIVSILSLVIWFGVGGLWMKLLGWW